MGVEGVDFEERNEDRACQTDYSECELKNDLVLQSLNHERSTLFCEVDCYLFPSRTVRSKS